MVTFKQLNLTNSKYNKNHLDKLECLYLGNEHIAKRTDLFFKAQPNEHPDVFKARCDNVYYTNYFAMIIRHYKQSLFHKGFTVNHDSKDAFYDQIITNCDLRETTLQNFTQDVFANALIYGKSYVGFDFPKDSDQAYLKHIKNECLIDWAKDEYGKFTLAVVKSVFCQRLSITDVSQTETTRFEVWEKRNQDVFCEIYEISYPKTKKPSDDSEVPLIESIQTTFSDIPIVTLNLKQDCIGSNIFSPCCRHFQGTSTLLMSQNSSLNSVKYIKQGPSVSETEIYDIDDEARGRKQLEALEANRKNFIVLNSNDDVGYLEPRGNTFEIVYNQLNDLVDEIFRLAQLSSLSIASTSSSVARSGQSKVADLSNTAKALRAQGLIVRNFVSKLLKQIASERQDEVSFEVSGLDDFESDTIDKFSKLIPIVESIDMHSDTYNKQLRNKISKLTFDNLSPELEKQISEEISVGIDNNGHEERQNQ